MRRAEAAAALVLAVALVVAGLVWLFGPWGLLVPGALLGFVVLFVVEVDDPPTVRE